MRNAILICFLSICVYAQDSLKTENTYKGKNAVYVQFGGKCGVYSLNYERFFFDKKGIKLSYNIGFCFNNFVPVGRGPYIGLPVGLYLNIGKKRGQFSVGIHQLHNFQVYLVTGYVANGMWISQKQEEYIELKYSLSVGYRHIPMKKGIFYSFEGMLFTPSKLLYNRYNGSHGLISNNLFVNWLYFPWAGISLGYVF